MTGKTKKALETENSVLKEELSQVKIKLANLSEQHEKCNSEQTSQSNNLMCSMCDKFFGSLKDLKKHKSADHKTNEVFKCEKCNRIFNEEWKMNAHVKTHKQYECDHCSKTFKYLELKEKHTKISHENVKIYCYYYNNNKICPYNQECIFLHEESMSCKYGNLCERLLCMFKHEIETAEEKIENDVNIIEILETEIIEEESETAVEEIKIVNVDEQDDVELNDEISNCTFINPSQADQNLNDLKFKCDKCDFASARKAFVNDHKVAIHNWCSVCYSNFSNQEKLKKHTKKQHSKKKAN